MSEKSIFKNTPFLFIVFTAFLSVMGIGVIIPVIPFIIGNLLGPDKKDQIALSVSLLISIYSFCQFFAAPVWGALSDKYGRRPIMLFCLFGSAIGYFMFGLASSIWIVFLGRIIDGITGGDIPTMMAYVADITEPRERGKYYGILGATVGFGFILGPSIGGLLSKFGLSAPLFFAGGITLLSMLFGYFVLPESLSKKHRMADFSLKHLNPFNQLSYVLKNKVLVAILIIGTFYFLPFAELQGIGGVYFKDILNWQPENIGFFFLVLGLGDMFTQGFLAGKLLPKFGELKLVLGGFLLTAFAYAINSFIPLFPSTGIAYTYIIFYALGSGLFEPAFGGIIAGVAEPHEQGRVQGASQSVQAITRIIGPILAAILYPYNPSLPWISCVLFSVVGAILLYQNKGLLSSHLANR